jgi:dipeptidyl aminopeptidase/acylaminoacyl peptidase
MSLETTEKLASSRMEPLCRFVLLLFALPLSSIVLANSNIESAPFGLEDALGVVGVPTQSRPGALSKSGRWLAYVGIAEGDVHGHWPNTLGGGSLMVLDTRTGRAKAINGNRETVWGPAWSPDESRLAYYSDLDGSINLWIWLARTGKSKKVSDHVVAPAWPFQVPVWTPDGKSIVIRTAPSHPIHDATSQGCQNGTAVTCKVTPRSVTVLESLASDRREYRPSEVDSGGPASSVAGPSAEFDLSPPNSRLTADLVLLDAGSGATRILKKDSVVVWYSVSPRGDKVALSRQVGSVMGSGAMLYELSIVSLQSDAPEILIPTTIPMSFGMFTWSPDSQSLAYITQNSSAGFRPNDGWPTDVYRVDATSGNRRKLSTGEHPIFASYFGAVNGLVPYWSPSGDHLFFCANGQVWTVPAVGGPTTTVVNTPPDHEAKLIIPDWAGNQVSEYRGGTQIVVMTRNRTTKRDGFSLVDTRARTWHQAWEEVKNYGGFAQEPIASTNNNVIVYLAEDAKHPPDFWLVDGNLRHHRQLTHLNPRFEDNSMQLGTSRLIEYRLRDGTHAKGAVLLPTPYQERRRYPFLIRLYPGNAFKQSNLVNRFGMSDVGSKPLDNMQLFASHGYGVLTPEIPQHVGTAMRDIAEAVAAATDRLIVEGFADPARLGVFGHSYGGYATLATIVQSKRFKAAISGSAVSDIVSFYGYVDHSGDLRGVKWAEDSQGLEGGSPWQAPDRYFANSPIHFLDRVETPLLIWHGENDVNVPMWQSDEVYAGLKRLGKRVEYRRYPDEGHILQRFDHQSDLEAAEIAWFDRWLRSSDRGH